MEYSLVGCVPRLFYGPLAYHSLVLSTTKYHWFYPGTFFWINMRSLYNFSKCNELPKIESRCYVENFPGNLTPMKGVPLQDQLAVSSADYYYDDYNPTEVYDFYNKSKEVLQFCISKERLDKFYNFVDYIKANLENITFK